MAFNLNPKFSNGLATLPMTRNDFNVYAKYLNYINNGKLTDIYRLNIDLNIEYITSGSLRFMIRKSVISGYVARPTVDY